MGFHDALYMLNTPYASQEAVDFADRSMEMVSYYAIKASSDLAAERGKYQSYEGSLWSQGILPIDSIKLLKQKMHYLCFLYPKANDIGLIKFVASLQQTDLRRILAPNQQYQP